MENQEHVLAKADIRYVKTKLAKITTIVFLVIVVLSLVIGLKSGTWSYHSDGGKVINKNSPLYGQSYPAHDDQYIGWFGLDFYENSNGWEGYGVGVDYTVAKNMVASVKYYDLEGKDVDGEDYETIYAQLNVTF